MRVGNGARRFRVSFCDAARVRVGSPKSARAGYDRQNELAARVILANTAKYGGEGSLAVQWARLIRAKAQPTVRGPLFESRAA